MRATASILHLDLDAFFAAVEQRDKPSLRGKPVIVAGTGGRGVVSTASYEARKFGVGSAMSGREARARCPHAAFLSGRFHAYRETSKQVMQVLRDLSPLVEPLSLDEAFVDLAAAGLPDLEVATVTEVGEELRRRVQEVTGGLTATVGIASSKFLAKVASELDKPDGMTVVPPGTELDLLRPMKVTVIPGVGPATNERLRRAGIHTIAELEQVSEDELVRLLGQAQGHGLWQLARAQDSRPVVAEREAKSISVEGTYDTDLTDRKLMEGLLTRQAKEVGTRMRKNGFSGRTVSIKVRLHDFTTLSRSSTLSSPTDDGATIAPHRPRAARRPRHDGRRAAPRGRGVRTGRLGAGGPVRRRRGGGGGGGGGPRASPPHLAARRRRGPRRDGAGLGVGLGVGGGHRPLRDRRDAARAGAQLPDGRPGPPPLGTAAGGVSRPSSAVRSTSGSPGRSCAQRSRSASSTTATTG